MPSRSYSTGFPWRSWAWTFTFMGRLTMPYMPDRLRQPSKPSCSPPPAPRSGGSPVPDRSRPGPSPRTPGGECRSGGRQAARPLACSRVAVRSSRRPASFPSNWVTGVADFMKDGVVLLQNFPNHGCSSFLSMDPHWGTKGRLGRSIHRVHVHQDGQAPVGLVLFGPPEGPGPKGPGFPSRCGTLPGPGTGSGCSLSAQGRGAGPKTSGPSGPCWRGLIHGSRLRRTTAQGPDLALFRAGDGDPNRSRKGGKRSILRISRSPR